MEVIVAECPVPTHVEIVTQFDTAVANDGGAVVDIDVVAEDEGCPFSDAEDGTTANLAFSFEHDRSVQVQPRPGLREHGGRALSNTDHSALDGSFDPNYALQIQEDGTGQEHRQLDGLFEREVMEVEPERRDEPGKIGEYRLDLMEQCFHGSLNQLTDNGDGEIPDFLGK